MSIAGAWPQAVKPVTHRPVDFLSDFVSNVFLSQVKKVSLWSNLRARRGQSFPLARNFEQKVGFFTRDKDIQGCVVMTLDFLSEFV